MIPPRARRAARAMVSAVFLAAAAGGEGPSDADLERAVFASANTYRAGRGLPALAYDSRIAEVARLHSAAMAAGEVDFGHAGLRSRFEALQRSLSISAFAENVARHRRPAAEVPAAAIDAWTTSPRHAKNLRGPYEVSGVGVARDADGVVYLTQIFAAR